MLSNFRKIFVILFIFFIGTKNVYSSVLNCYQETLNQNSVCVDTGPTPEFSYSYWTCNSGNCNRQSGTVSCTFLGYASDGGHMCEQDVASGTGYYESAVCRSRCKCTPAHCEVWGNSYVGPCVGLGSMKYCKNATSMSCSFNNDCILDYTPCIKWVEEKCDSGGGQEILRATCCSGGSSGVGNPCVPKCPNIACTVTDAMCAAMNGNDTNYKTAESGNLCKGRPASCFQDNGCNGLNVCNTSPCYHIETNTSTIPTPSTNTLTVQDRSTDVVSNSQETPTLVPFPLTSTTPTSTSVNSISNPTGSRELIYNFVINNVLTSQSGSVLSNKPLASDLTEGSVGSIETYYSTLNRCDNNKKTGSPLKTYYKVNTLPLVTSLSIVGDNEKLKGCDASPSFTGQESNNPLTVTVTGSDVNGTNTINGMFLWIVKDGTSVPSNYLNKRYPIGPGGSQNTQNMIGIFFALGSNATSRWVTVYKAMIDSNGNLTGWGRDANANDVSQTYVKDSVGDTLIESIEVAYPEIKDNKMTFEVNLKFPNDSKVLGNYKFYTSLTDTLSYYKIGANTYTELRTLYSNGAWTWNFDFVNPTISNFSQEVTQRLATVNWKSSDVGSSIKDTVVNVYNARNPESGKTAVRIKPISSNNNEVSVLPPPDSSSSIGLINPLSSGWYYYSPYHPPLYPPSGPPAPTSTTIDIGENDSGILQFYVTVYDQACNYTTSNVSSFDLNRWVSTKGGILFSKGAIRYIPKTIYGEEYNLGTELITTYSSNNPESNDFGENKNPTSVINVTDGNTLEPNRFDLLKSKFDRYKLGLKHIDSLDDCSREEDEVCILETEEDIHISSTEYKGKIIVVSSKDIIVEPDIKSNNTLNDGLILFAGGNIVINSTSTKTTGGIVEYDQLDAFMISRGQIQISSERNRTDNLQDGVKVFGSLISFAKDGNIHGLLLQRDLGLLNVTNPVLIVNYHPKYAKISEIFFGKDNSAYKQEVGFKIL